MLHKIQIQPVCRGPQDCGKPGRAGVKDLDVAWKKMVFCPCGCGTEKAEPVAQP